jgi:uncharacterized membrane protein
MVMDMPKPIKVIWRWLDNLDTAVSMPGLAKWGFAAMTGIVTAGWGIIQGLTGVWIFVAIFWTFVAVVWVWIGVAHLRSRRWRAASKTTMNAGSPQVYLGRPAFRRALPIHEMIGQGDNIDAIYMNASFILSQDLSNIRRLRRVILPNPKHEAFLSLVDACGETQENLTRTIETAIERFRRANIEVRLYRGWVVNSMHIADYDKPNGWAQVEVVFLDLHQDDRPILMVRKPANDHTIRALADAFNHMWEKHCDQIQ